MDASGSAVRLRREHFGTTVQTGTSINAPAAAVLLACRTPQAAVQIATQPGHSPADADVARFLADCCRCGWQEPAPDDRPSAAQLYFTDVNSFSPPHLHMPVAPETTDQQVRPDTRCNLRRSGAEDSRRERVHLGGD